LRLGPAEKERERGRERGRRERKSEGRRVKSGE